MRLSDGSTNVLPVGGTDAVRAAWELHARLVRRSLERGFYQGWDLHPAQLPTRYAATYAFFRDGRDAAVDPAARATWTGGDSGIARRAGDRPRAGRVPAARPGLRRPRSDAGFDPADELLWLPRLAADG